MSTEERTKTPEEMYEEYRQISIDANDYFIESTEKLLSNFYKANVPIKEAENALKVANQSLAFAYRSFPYVQILFKWEHENFPFDDLRLFSQYMPNLYEYEENIIRIYLRTLDLYTKNEEENADSPEKAEKPLTAEENRLFCFFLENIVKPATTNFINSIKEGNYRSIREIDNDKTSMKLGRINTKALSKLNEELERPSRDIFLYLKIYSTDCNFPQIIEDALKNTFKVEKVFEVSKFEMPLDKINRTIWNFPISPKEDLTFAMESQADKRKGRELDAAYSIDFSALEESENIKITKKLTPFDKRVYAAISAIYNAGNTVTSLTQIYFAMGNTSRPPKSSIEHIYNSIIKMIKAHITLDNEDEAKVYNYPHFKYEGNLLPIEMLSNVDIRGKITESAINIFREPPLLSFAKGRKQVTTVPVKLLQSPISKTESNLMLEDYLIYRISKAKATDKDEDKGKNKGKDKDKKDKKPKLSNIIKLETLYREMEITDRRAKPRLLDKVERCLKYYKELKYIVDYEITKEEIILKFKEEENKEETATA